MQIDQERLALIIARHVVGPCAAVAHDDDYACVDAILGAISEDIAAQGFVIVPREPTEAACTCLEVYGEDPRCAHHGENTEWSAMIEAGKDASND